MNLLNLAVFNTAFFKSILQVLRINQDGGKQIIEVVGNATCQDGHRFQTLSCCQPFFSGALLSDVTPDTLDLTYVTIRVENRPIDPLVDDNLTITGDIAVFVVQDGAVFRESPEVVSHP